MNLYLGRPWTHVEDDAVRARYIADGSAALSAQIHRTNSSVQHRAARIGVVKNRRWTADEDKALRYAWGEQSLARIARELNRSALTTYWRAQKLGLSLGCPDGYEYLSRAAERSGYTTTQLRRILVWGRVKVRRAMSRNTVNARRAPHYVVPFDVDAALERWHRTETVECAARRLGLCGDTLRRWLVEAGHRKPRGFRVHWRVDSVAIDEVVAMRGMVAA